MNTTQAKWACLVLALFYPAVLLAECEVPPAEALRSFENALAARRAGRAESAADELGELHRRFPTAARVAYEYGRTLLMQKDYAKAAPVLAQVDPNCLPENIRPAVLNTRGWALLMLSRYDESLAFFEAAQREVAFGSAGETRKKVYNNAGLAYLQLDRYEESKANFSKAYVEGSGLAAENLKIVDSILQVVEAQNPDVPGIFAPVVGSARRFESADRARARISKRLGVPRHDLDIFFQQDTPRYHLTWGASLSYPKAQQFVREARSKGVGDAYVASVINWKDVSTGMPD